MSNLFNSFIAKFLKENNLSGGVFGGSSEIGAHGGDVGNSDWYAPNDARNVFGLDIKKEKKRKKKGKGKISGILMPVQRRPMIREAKSVSLRPYYGSRTPMTAFNIILPDDTIHRSDGRYTIVYAHSENQAKYKFGEMFPRWKFKKDKLKVVKHKFTDPTAQPSKSQKPKENRPQQGELFKL